MKDKFLYFLWILLTVLHHRLVVLTGYIHLVQKFIFPIFMVNGLKPRIYYITLHYIKSVKFPAVLYIMYSSILR